MSSPSRAPYAAKIGLIVIFCILFSLALTVKSTSAERTIVSAEQIAEAVKNFILRSACWPEDSLQVNCRRQSGVELEGTGKVKLVVSLATNKPLVGLVPVKVQVWLNHALKRQLLVTAEVRLFRKVVVAKRDIRRGEALTAQNLKIERKEVTYLRGRYFSKLDQLQGKRARLVVPQGTVLTTGKVEAIPVIKRGSKVKIIVQWGNVTAWTEGIALQEGNSGQFIWVRNSHSGKRLSAKVLNSHTVRVVF